MIKYVSVGDDDCVQEEFLKPYDEMTDFCGRKLKISGMKIKKGGTKREDRKTDYKKENPDVFILCIDSRQNPQ